MKGRLETLIREMIDRGLQLDEARDAFEREYIRQVLERHEGNQTRAAATLEMHRNTLRRKLRDHGLL